MLGVRGVGWAVVAVLCLSCMPVEAKRFDATEPCPDNEAAFIERMQRHLVRSGLGRSQDSLVVKHRSPMCQPEAEAVLGTSDRYLISSLQRPAAWMSSIDRATMYRPPFFTHKRSNSF
jgi:hypothetical protein